MKKLNYSWKVAGFALLFGLSMGLQSCDEMIDNPLSPTQPTSQQTTPATPATPKATVKGSTVTIENCATTKDVNTLLASADVKKVFTDTEYSYYDSINAQTVYNTIEVIVKGGLETADAIAIPGTGHNPKIQLTFNDAFTKAEKDLAIKNDAGNTNTFTVKLPDSDSGINLDLTVTNNTWNNYVTGNAVLNSIKGSVITPDTNYWKGYALADIHISGNTTIKAYDFDKQEQVFYYVSGTNPIEAVVLNSKNTDNSCYKKGFAAQNVQWDYETCYVPNAIVAAGETIGIWPSSQLSTAKKIYLEKGAKLNVWTRGDADDQYTEYTPTIESIEGADRSAQYLNGETESWSWYDANNKEHKVIYKIGSISNVTIPNFWGYLPSNVSNVTIGDNSGDRVYLPSSMKSISGLDFNCDVRIDLAVAETGMGQFTFENCNFGASSNNIGFTPESRNYLKDASGNVIYVTVYTWKDKDGVIHTDTKNPSGDAKFDYMVSQFEQPAFDTVKYEDFKAYLSFVGCKIDGKDVDSKLLSPMVYQQDFGDGSQVIYQIGYNSNYRLSDSGVLVAF